VLTTLGGSAVVALATLRGKLTAGEAWAAAHIDEDWQIEHWGADTEAAARLRARRADFDAANRVLALMKGSSSLPAISE
jgi:chaperone required for assembly of F1-ATPase